MFQGLRKHVILSDQRERRISQNGVAKPGYWEILHFATLVQNDMHKSYVYCKAEMTDQEIQTQVMTWRKAEDRFYQSALNMPEVYTDSIHLVRALANNLSHLADVETLVRAYQEFDLDQVGLIAEGLALPHLDFIDFELARDAAFYLRYQEILDTQDRAKIQARLAEAKAQAAQWVTLYDQETKRQGRTFFQRLEMRLPDGLGLYTAVELDLEKGRVYVLEPIMLDPASGEPRRGVVPPDPRREFATREELAAEATRLRSKYST